MCLAIPGKIVEKKGNDVVVDYGSEKREARVIEGEYSVGDYVIVEAKVVSEKVDDEQVQGWLQLLRE